jgi:RNA polymerase sigma factor (sigma-70 family)
MTAGSLPDVLSQLRRVAASALPSDADLIAAFVNERNEAAFKQLAERHGPMVFGVCKRVLGHIQDAEDAFQAVFIVLARKADVISPPAAVGRWLYGTAVRTARKAKSRRERQQRQLANRLPQQMEVTRVESDPNDWLPVFDEEMVHLSDKHRLPIVLCDVLGRSRQEAAAELGIAEGTLSSRLARARECLRCRLVRRGVVPSAGAISFDIAVNANAEVPRSLLESIVHIGQGSVTSAISQSATNLAEGVIRSMFLSKLQQSLFIAILIAVLGGATWIGASYLMADPKEPALKDLTPGNNEVALRIPEPKGKPDEKRLSELRTARVEALKNQITGLEARLQAGKDPLSTLLDAYKKLLDAELSLCKTNEQCMKAYEAAVKRFKAIEELTLSELEAGKKTRHEVEQVKAARLEIEILWELAKSK